MIFSILCKKPYLQLAYQNVMLMRTVFAYLAILCLMLTSCVQSECLLPLDTEIGFTALTGNSTKALINDGVLSNASPFDVWGFYSGDGTFCEFDSESNPNFMNGLKMEWTADALNSKQNAWRNRNNHYYYWPLSGKIGFYALYPSGISGVQIPEFKGKGIQINNYKVDVTNKYSDLMYAYVVGNSHSNVLPIRFKHALSQIELVLELEDANSGADLYVTEIDIINVDLSAQFNYVQTEIAGSWSRNMDDPTETIKYCDNNVLLTDVPLTYATAMVVIPQGLKEAALQIKYNLVSEGGNVISGTLVKDISSLNDEWEMSTRYIYRLSFRIDEDNLIPSVNVALSDIVSI